jgi:nucleotide-binding universal stress UspA family protein
MPKPGQLVAGQGGAIVTYVGPEHGRLEAEAREYLESAAARVGGTAETVVRYGDASAEIAAAAQDYGAAAVVMATHGRTGLFRSVIGSVAGSVLHHSSSPVVLIRSAGVGSTEQQPGSEQTATAPAG